MIDHTHLSFAGVRRLEGGVGVLRRCVGAGEDGHPASRVHAHGQTAAGTGYVIVGPMAP